MCVADPYIAQMNSLYGESHECYRPCSLLRHKKHKCVNDVKQYNASIVTANATTSSAAGAITQFTASIHVFNNRLANRSVCALVQYMSLVWLVTTLLQYTTIGLT
jgi:hypothetical protein